MKSRDRMVLLALAIAGVLVATWIGVVSPQRQKASQAQQALSAAETRRTDSLGKATAAQRAASSFSANVADVTLLSQAVPASEDVAALLRQLEATAQQQGVNFRGITTAPSSSASAPVSASQTQKALAATNGTAPAPASGSPGPAPTSAAGAGAPGAAVPGLSVASLPTESFTFTFDGSFLSLERFLDAVHHYTTAAGPAVHVHGRLISFQGLTLAAAPGGGAAPAGGMEATVTAAAYILPPGQSPAELIAAVNPSLAAARTARPVRPATTPGGPTAVPATAIKVGP